MAIAVLIIGKSGSGKSASMRNCVGDPDWNIIKVLNKPLPFRGKLDGWTTDDYNVIFKCLKTSRANSIVIDDAGYLLTNMFMRGHSNYGQGNAIFTFYNQIGDHFWNLIQFIQEKLPENKIIYMLMHEEKDESGDVKAKTIGKMLDEKVCVEGLFTVVLRCIEEGGKHLFVTQAADGAISKSPDGMFEELKIDNDLKIVDEAIRNYWDIKKEEHKDGKTEVDG